jgi:phage virion morphogenesis protein
MAGVQFDIRVDDGQVLRALAALELAAADLAPAWDGIGSMLVTQSLHHFETQSGPDGAKWAPLAASTLRGRRGRRGTPAVLQDRGHLRGSITSQPGADGVSVGSNLVYAAIHHFGGTVAKAAHSRQVYFKQSDIRAGRRRFVSRGASDFAQWATVGAHDVTIPARPYLPVLADGTLPGPVADEVVAILRDHLTAGLRDLGGLV